MQGGVVGSQNRDWHLGQLAQEPTGLPRLLLPAKNLGLVWLSDFLGEPC